MAEIYNDSKTFVDKPLINPVDQVLFNFDVFMQVIISVFTDGDVTQINGRLYQDLNKDRGSHS